MRTCDDFDHARIHDWQRRTNSRISRKFENMLTVEFDSTESHHKTMIVTLWALQYCALPNGWCTLFIKSVKAIASTWTWELRCIHYFHRPIAHIRKIRGTSPETWYQNFHINRKFSSCCRQTNHFLASDVVTWCFRCLICHYLVSTFSASTAHALMCNSQGHDAVRFWGRWFCCPYE